MLCAWQQLPALAEWYWLHGNSCIFDVCMAMAACFSWVILATQQQLHVWYCVHSNSCRLELSDIGYIATPARLVLCAQQQRYALDRWYWLHGDDRVFDVVCMAMAACFSRVILVAWQWPHVRCCVHGNSCMFQLGDIGCIATAVCSVFVCMQ